DYFALARVGYFLLTGEDPAMLLSGTEKMQQRVGEEQFRELPVCKELQEILLRMQGYGKQYKGIKRMVTELKGLKELGNKESQSQHLVTSVRDLLTARATRYQTQERNKEREQEGLVEEHNYPLLGFCILPIVIALTLGISTLYKSTAQNSENFLPPVTSTPSTENKIQPIEETEKLQPFFPEQRNKHWKEYYSSHEEIWLNSYKDDTIENK
ncbi:MAG: hypothetical protein Q7K45_03365, partial [Nanoarchaeota archaeon]|nr:hypothetical protein [Nanoarchaeota archaeon]